MIFEEYLLVVEHADGLDRFNGMGELYEAVTSRFSVPIFVDLGGNDSTGKPEHFAKFLIVDSERKLKMKVFFTKNFTIKVKLRP